MRLLLDVVGSQAAQLLELLNHRGDNQVDNATQQSYHKYQCDNNAQRPVTHMQLILHELHHRVKQIGQQPGHKKWQQHTTQIVNQQQDAKYQQSYPHPTHQLVKRDCLFFHSLPL